MKAALYARVTGDHSVLDGAIERCFQLLNQRANKSVSLFRPVQDQLNAGAVTLNDD